MGCGNLFYGPLDHLRSKRDCLNLPKWRKTTEAACATFFLQMEIVLWHISLLSESEVLTTDLSGKQRWSIGQGIFLKLVWVCAWSKAIVWSQVAAFFFLSKWGFLFMNLSPAACYWAYTGAGLCRSQEGHSPPPALPGMGTLHITRGSSSATQSPLRRIAAAPPPVHLLFSHSTLGQWNSICIPQQTLIIPCSGPLLSRLPIEKIMSNFVSVTHERLMEVIAFPSTLLSFFWSPGECQQLSSTVDFQTWWRKTYAISFSQHAGWFCVYINTLSVHYVDSFNIFDALSFEGRK